jgi:hypothetical protein
MYNLIDAVFAMRLDTYRQVDSQDENTGEIKKEWQYYKTMPCHAKGIISNSATRGNGDVQTIGNRYLNEQLIQIRTHDKMSIREKVTNIVSSNGEQIWTELDFPSNTPTVFEIIGTTPMTDPFGNIVAYNSIMKRSENQIIGR